MEAELKPETADNKDGITAKLGDVVNIDFKGMINGVAFDGGTGKDFNLGLGSKQFIPGFEDQLVGAKAGEERTVKVTFPKDYPSAEVAGKEAEFIVNVKAINSNKTAQGAEQSAAEPSAQEKMIYDELMNLYQASAAKILALNTQAQKIEDNDLPVAKEKCLKTAKTSTRAWVAGAIAATGASVYFSSGTSLLPRALMALGSAGAGLVGGFLATHNQEMRATEEYTRLSKQIDGLRGMAAQEQETFVANSRAFTEQLQAEVSNEPAASFASKVAKPSGISELAALENSGTSHVAALQSADNSANAGKSR